MPTYCYQCRKCLAEHEAEHGVNDPGPQQCQRWVPNSVLRCGGALKRLLYPVRGWLVGGPTA